MLLELAQWLAKDIRAFNVFSYITLRAVMATLTALAIALIAGPMVIRKLTAYKIGQSVRDDGPQTHLIKAGTPTMGGALILIAIGIATLLWADLTNRFVWIVLVVTLGFGAIGWVDDWRKVVHKNPKGLSAREKYFWQSLVGIIAAVYLAFAVSAPNTDKIIELVMKWIASGFTMELPQKANLIVPFFKEISYPLGVFGFITLSLISDTVVPLFGPSLPKLFNRIVEAILLVRFEFPNSGFSSSTLLALDDEPETSALMTAS